MKQLSIAIYLFFSSTILTAQEICPSILDLETMQTQNPVRYQHFMDLETFTSNYIDSSNGTSHRLINQNGIITIPVVIHVLHRNESVGDGRNLSLSQIQSQIDVLNEDFRRLNTDRTNTPTPFNGVASDYGLEFRLACQDPNGNPTDGIIRRYTNKKILRMLVLEVELVKIQWE